MMDGLSDRGVALPQSDLRGTEPVLTRQAAEYKPTPAEEGESGSLNSRGQREDSAELTEQGQALAEREADRDASEEAGALRGESEGASELREGRSYQETLRNMRAVRRDALAPPRPPAEDLRIAVQAQRIVNQVRSERVAEARTREALTRAEAAPRPSPDPEPPRLHRPEASESETTRAVDAAEAFRPPSPADPDGTSSISFFA